MGVAKPIKKLKKGKYKKKKLDIDKLIKKANHKIDITFLYTPLKKKPCKGCPALNKDICKCARKLFK